MSYEALREAIVNVVVHRDYHRIGETVRVFMHTDRVEIRSSGGLLPGISLDELVAMLVTSVPRNPLIAGFLHDMPGYMERIGSGIRFMVTQMRERACPPRSSAITWTSWSPFAMGSRSSIRAS